MTKSNSRSRRRRFTRRDFLTILIPTVAAIAVVFIALLVTDHGSTYELQGEASQYYAGSVAHVPKGMELKMDENGKIVFVDGSETGTETTLPLYMNQKRSVILTTDMIYYAPRSDASARVAALSEVTSLENGVIKVERDGETVRPDLGFLYDGKNFYLFLEPVIVTFSGYTVELPALSYAEVVYGGSVMLFNYETKQFTIEDLVGTVNAATKYGDYTISLLGDSMTNVKGELTLLMTRPEDLEILQ